MTMDDLVASKGFVHGLPSNAILFTDGFIVVEHMSNGIDNLVVGCLNDSYSVGLSRGIVKLVRNRKNPIVTYVDGNYKAMNRVILALEGQYLGGGKYVWQ